MDGGRFSASRCLVALLTLSGFVIPVSSAWAEDCRSQSATCGGSITPPPLAGSRSEPLKLDSPQPLFPSGRLLAPHTRATTLAGQVVDSGRCLGMTAETEAVIEAYVEEATTTVDIGLLVAGGISTPLGDSASDLDGVFHLALTGGMTYALGLDVERYCNDPEAPLPAGLGWQILVATNDFDDLEVGALARYHGELDLTSPDLLLELGGLYRFVREAQDAPGVLLSVGVGTQVLQVLAQGQLLFDDSLTLIAIAGVRVDAYLFRLLF